MDSRPFPVKTKKCIKDGKRGWGALGGGMIATVHYLSLWLDLGGELLLLGLVISGWWQLSTRHSLPIHCPIRVIVTVNHD